MPGQLSIIGFDDLELAAQLQPALTTVRVPAEAMWRSAADRVLAALAGDPLPPDAEIEVALVVRDSTAPPARAKRLRAVRER